MIKVIKSGFYTTIQDLGRYGYQDYGVPISGVMDEYSAQFANALLNNDKNDAVLEITMNGPTLQYDGYTLICISGADISPMLNGKEIKLNSIISVNTNDVLTYGKLNYGFRSYLAIKGGFQSELKLKSGSMYKNVTSKYKIEANDTLHFKEISPSETSKFATLKFNKAIFTSNIIEVYKGPEFELLSPIQQQQLFDQDFTVSNLNDRMAYQLEEHLENDLKPIITSLVLPGTVQLTPSGSLIVLMRDCQTTGGYPRILQLKESSINCLAQKYQGQKIQLQLIN
jgi:biotin-dependent carboxylase-like uncharacterized protein